MIIWNVHQPSFLALGYLSFVSNFTLLLAQEFVTMRTILLTLRAWQDSPMRKSDEQYGGRRVDTTRHWQTHKNQSRSCSMTQPQLHRKNASLLLLFSILFSNRKMAQEYLHLTSDSPFKHRTNVVVSFPSSLKKNISFVCLVWQDSTTNISNVQFHVEMHWSRQVSSEKIDLQQLFTYLLNQNLNH